VFCRVNADSGKVFINTGRASGQEGPAPLQYLCGAFRVIGPSWKMLNQPPVSPLTLAMTENY